MIWVPLFYVLKVLSQAQQKSIFLRSTETSVMTISDLEKFLSYEGRELMRQLLEENEAISSYDKDD